MKIKTQDLTDLALNWAVAKADGTPIYRSGKTLTRMDTAHLIVYWQPTIDWSQAGPIIERECIAIRASGACSVAPKNPDYWVAEILDTREIFTQYGPTPLVAAMRCYVASKMGDEVNVPEELL